MPHTLKQIGRSETLKPFGFSCVALLAARRRPTLSKPRPDLAIGAPLTQVTGTRAQKSGRGGVDTNALASAALVLQEHSSVTLRSTGNPVAATAWCRGDWFHGTPRGTTRPTLGTHKERRLFTVPAVGHEDRLLCRMSGGNRQQHRPRGPIPSSLPGGIRLWHGLPPLPAAAALAHLAARRLGICASGTTQSRKASLLTSAAEATGVSRWWGTTGMPHPAPTARGGADQQLRRATGL